MTVAEAIRQPVSLLLALSCVVFTIALPLILAHNFGEEGRLARDGGLAFQFVFGLFITGYAACTSFAGKENKGSVALILAKPVGRGTLLAAKYAGVVCVIFLFSLSASLATLIAERVAEKYLLACGYKTDGFAALIAFTSLGIACLISAYVNFARKRSFQSSVFLLMPVFLLLSIMISGLFNRGGHRAPFDTAVQWQIIPAGILIAMALMILASIAITLSVRLSLVPTISFCIALFLLGLISDYFFGSSQSPIDAFLYKIIPNWQHFWMADALSENGSVPWRYVSLAGLYATAYSLAAMCLGGFLFRRTPIT